MLPSDSQPAEPVITPPPRQDHAAHAAADDDASMYVLENGILDTLALPSTGTQAGCRKLGISERTLRQVAALSRRRNRFRPERKNNIRQKFCRLIKCRENSMSGKRH